MGKYFLSIDAGTTSSRTILFSTEGEIIAISQYEFPQIYPERGWVEHNPEKIWETQVKTLKEVVEKAKVSINDIISIGITNQRETTVLWDKSTLEPVYNAIVWQCRRTAEMCEEIKKDNYDNAIFKKTGLIVDPYFSATKIKWILENVDKAKKVLKKGNLRFGTIDSWLLFKLTGGKAHKTDYSNASRTMLFNIKELKWDPDLLKYFNIPEEILPQIQDSASIFGYLDKSILGKEIPITGILGDQQAALFGQTCFSKNEAKMTYGTGGFILYNTGENLIYSKNRLLTTIAWAMNKKITYAIEGSVFIAGAVIQWLRDNLKFFNKSSDSEIIANTVKDSGGVIFIPAFTGLGAPYWSADVKGAIFGLRRDTRIEHIVRAALEGIAYSTKDVVDAIEKDAGAEMKTLKVDGGASQNNLLMQFQSDILNIEIIRPVVFETTALGAAFISGIGAGYFNSTDNLKKVYKIDKVFKPLMDKVKREKLYDNWKKYIKKLID